MKFFFITAIPLVTFFLLLNLAVVKIPNHPATSGHWAHLDQINSDGATFVATATAHQKGLGTPYKDYWEYRPPGFYLLLDLWSKAFGAQIGSLKILETLIHFFLGIAICLVFRKLFSPFKSLLLSILTIATFFSPVFGSLLYPDPYCIFFSLLGLLSLLYLQSTGWRFFLAALFFSFSIQLKESFWGASLALIPPLWSLFKHSDRKIFLKGSFFTLAGFLLPLPFLWFYLTNLGAVSAYFEVLHHKSQAYDTKLWSKDYLFMYYHFFWNSKRYIALIPHQSLIILTLLLGSALLLIFKKISALSLDLKNRSISLKISYTHQNNYFPQRLGLVTVLLFSFGSFLGPVSISTLSPHYMVAVIIPTYFIWAIFALFLENRLRSLYQLIPANLIFILTVLILLYPGRWVTNEYQVVSLNLLQQAWKNITLPQGNIQAEKYIKSKTDPSDCILSVYGWKSSDAYLYAERKPCTRFIVPNIVTAPWQKEEYRQAILNHPPQAIIYSPAEADMDYRRFEKEVIDIPKILEHCYKLDSTYSYSYVSYKLPIQHFISVVSKEELRACVHNNLGN